MQTDYSDTDAVSSRDVPDDDLLGLHPLMFGRGPSGLLAVDPRRPTRM